MNPNSVHHCRCKSDSWFVQESLNILLGISDPLLNPGSKKKKKKKHKMSRDEASSDKGTSFKDIVEFHVPCS